MKLFLLLLCLFYPFVIARGTTFIFYLVVHIYPLLNLIIDNLTRLELLLFYIQFLIITRLLLRCQRCLKMWMFHDGLLGLWTQEGGLGCFWAVAGEWVAINLVVFVNGLCQDLIIQILHTHNSVMINDVSDKKGMIWIIVIVSW